MKADQVSFLFLFRSFLKIGLTSFGGHAALVSVLQEELVKKQKVITDEEIVDAMSVASLLPGPLAVNVVTFVGYKLKGWGGAFTSMFAVLLPPFILMILIAQLYTMYSDLEYVNRFLSGVIPVIIALILSLCYNLFKKNITSYWHYILFAVILVAAFFYNTYLWIVGYIVFGGIVGFLFRSKNNEETPQNSTQSGLPRFQRRHLFSGFVSVLLIFLILFISLKGVYYQLLAEFSKVSLTLFGGGYVMIPLLHEIVVESREWLSSSEFTNAIAFGQITPGPILVTATYVGFRVAGVLGAIIGTVGIFVPSAVVMVLAGSVFENVKNLPTLSAIMKGVRPVIIALIAYSGWILFDSQDQILLPAIITALSFIIITFTRINYFLVILTAGLLGLLIF